MDPDLTPAPPPTDTPATTDLATEVTRLTGLLEAAQAENTELHSRVQALEGQVDDTKQKELEGRLAALEAEREALKGENDGLKATAARAEQMKALAGKVRDPEAALLLLTDDLKTKDGQPDVEKIIGRYPYLAPQGVTTPTAPGGAGGVQAAGSTTLDAAVATKDTAAINAAFEAELKGAQ